MTIPADAEPIDADSAQRWGEVAPPSGGDALAEAVDLLDDVAATPYLMNEELNFRIALWQGELTSLKVDAIINCNNEELNERAGVSGTIFAAAGPQMEEACTRLGGCAPGEAKATRGFRLPAKHVIHTVPPPWSDGANAEAALEKCYAASVQAALKLHCSTIAFCCVKSRDAPRESCAHVALRTIRKLLEQPSTRGIQLALFAMRPQDVYDSMVYENLLPLYFPRSAGEEHEAAKLLPLAQQAAAQSGHASMPTGTGDAPPALLQQHSSTAMASVGSDPNPALASLTQPLKQNSAYGNQAIGAVGNTAAKMATADEAMLRSSAYASFLHRAGLADLSDIESMQLFYRAGVDARGRPIFLFWAGHLPSRPVDLERVLMHLMRTLDQHVHAGYILVYIHTTLSPENEPPFQWLRKVYDLFDNRLKENLHLLYIIHPSWWLKMVMNFMRTFSTGSNKFWDSKVIQLPHLSDLFKRNYFTPGSLRMPDSPLVRKYLEMSNDLHMLEAIAGEDATVREARANALASAVSAGAISYKSAAGGGLPAGAAPVERAAVAMAAAEREPDAQASEALAQAQASKEILLKQLIELSDQLAHSRASSDAVETRLGHVSAAKDREINRLSNALYDAQREVDDARAKLHEVEQHATTMEDQRRERSDALAELADLEGQLAQTQVYNHHMAKELVSLHKQVRHDKWELLHEMSSLERQLEAAKAMRFVGGGAAAEGGDDALAVTVRSRVEEIGKLQAELSAQRGEVAAAVRALNEQHGEMEFALKRAAEEAASVRGAELARQAAADERHRELQTVAHELEGKIGAIRVAASLGLSSATDQQAQKTNELSELEQLVAAAASEVARIEERLSVPADGELSVAELEELQASLNARLMVLDRSSLEGMLDEVHTRKDLAMQAVATQLVPQMSEMQARHAVERERLERLLKNPGDAANPEARSALVEQIEAQAAQHESQLAELEKRAAEALASLEETFEKEVEQCGIKSRAQAAERQRILARLEGVAARIRGLQVLGPVAPGLLGEAHGELSMSADGQVRAASHTFAGAGEHAYSSPNKKVQSDAVTLGPGGRRMMGTSATTLGAVNATSTALAAPRKGGGGGIGAYGAEWITEKIAFFFEESADHSLRRCLQKWLVNATFIAGMHAATGGGGNPAWVQTRAEKVAMIRQMDEQEQQLNHASMVLALKADSEAAPPSPPKGGGLPAAVPPHQLGPSEVSAAREVMSLRKELRTVYDQFSALQQQHGQAIQQLEVARHQLAVVQPLHDIAVQQPLSVGVTPVPSTIASGAAEDGHVIEEDAWSLAARLEAERVSLEASLAIGNDALAAAEQVQDEHGKEAAGLHMMELKAKLVALQPQISLARERQDALRRRAEVALQQSGLGEASHQSVGSLGEAHALIAVLQDKLKAAEAAPRRKGSRSGAPAAAQPVLDPDL